MSKEAKPAAAASERGFSILSTREYRRRCRTAIAAAVAAAAAAAAASAAALRLSFPYEGEAISAAPLAVGGARRITGVMLWFGRRILYRRSYLLALGTLPR